MIEQDCKCEAVGCDGKCRGPYVYWFGIKFVVDKRLYDDMMEYYCHIIPHRKNALMKWTEPGRALGIASWLTHQEQ
jgi:hypothetical protein